MTFTSNWKAGEGLFTLRCLESTGMCLASADFVAAQSVLRNLLAQLSLPTEHPVLAQGVADPTWSASSARRCYVSAYCFRPATELVAPRTTNIHLVFVMGHIYRDS